jgi:hypothetical protein
MLSIGGTVLEVLSSRVAFPQPMPANISIAAAQIAYNFTTRFAISIDCILSSPLFASIIGLSPAGAIIRIIPQWANPGECSEFWQHYFPTVLALF